VYILGVDMATILLYSYNMFTHEARKDIEFQYVNQFNTWLDSYFGGFFSKVSSASEFFTIVRKFCDRQIKFGEKCIVNELEFGFVNEQILYDKELIESFFREPGGYLKIPMNLYKNLGLPLDCYLFLMHDEVGDCLMRSGYRYLESELCVFSEREIEVLKRSIALTKEKLAVDEQMRRIKYVLDQH